MIPRKPEPGSTSPSTAAGEHSLRSPAAVSPNIEDPLFLAKREFAELDVWRQSVLFKISRYEALKEEAKLWYPDLAADAQLVEQVGDYELQVGAKSIEKDWVSMRRVFAAVGSMAKFLKLCKVTFKALEQAIGKEKAEALQVEERTGSRRIKAFKTEPAQQKAAA